MKIAPCKENMAQLEKTQTDFAWGLAEVNPMTNHVKSARNANYIPEMRINRISE